MSHFDELPQRFAIEAWRDGTRVASAVVSAQSPDEACLQFIHDHIIGEPADYLITFDPLPYGEQN